MLERRTFELTEIRATDGAKPVIEGHAAVFGVKSTDPGLGFREIIQRGAFTEAILSDDVRFLVNHEGLPIARTKSRTLVLSEDAKGLAFRAELDPTDPDVQRLMPKVKRGDLSEMSFGFAVRDRTTGEKWYREDGEAVRSLLKVSLYDVSVVPFAAYPSTDLQIRGFYEARMKELDTASIIDTSTTIDAAAAEINEQTAFLASMKARQEFVARRTPPPAAPDPLSLSEIIKRSRIKT